MRLCAHAVGITAPLKHGGNAATNRGPERPDDPTAWLQGKTTLARKAASGWKRQFNDAIPLPRGRRLVTLEDAGNYITKLPKAEHGAPGMAGSGGGLDPGRDAWRPDDVRADRCHAAAEPPCRTRV